MKMDKLIRAASKYYPEDYVLKCAEGKGGDTLASFIANEIVDTYDPDLTEQSQIDEAVRVLERGVKDLKLAIRGLKELEKGETA